MKPSKSATSLPFVDVPTFNAFWGIWDDSGPFTISNRESPCLSPSYGLILSLVSSWAIRPENLLKVLGSLMCWETLISTPFFVSINTRRRPALFNGVSSNANKLWCTISGLKSSGSCKSFVSMNFLWSSELINSTPFLV